MKQSLKRQVAWIMAVVLLFALNGFAETLPDVSASENANRIEDSIVKNAKDIPSTLKLGVDEQYTLSVKKATFESSKPDVATVNKKGIITAVKTGTTKITVTKKGKKIGTCKVNVLAAPDKVTLSKTKATLEVGQTLKLKAKLPKNTASLSIKWTSSSSKVAQVDDNGVVTAMKPGKAKITVKTFNGKKATCAVTVKKQPEPTATPTVEPTATPTVEPTATSTVEPTATPTAEPTATPTVEPTATPTAEPTATPTAEPTATPTAAPTATPTVAPADGDFVTYDGKVIGYTGAGGAIEIPAKDAQGNAITAIGEAAFKGHTEITSVTIPSSVTEIGASAFEGCSNLVTIEASNGVKVIGKAAFKDCRKLARMNTAN